MLLLSSPPFPVAMSGRVSKMMAYLNWRMKVTLTDRRVLLGSLLAFDRHMNLVLADCEEVRTIRAKKSAAASGPDGAQSKATTAGDEDVIEQKRTLGLVLIRGESVVSVSAHQKPPPPPKAAVLAARSSTAAPPGSAAPAGRGMPIINHSAMPPSGLAGPIRGVGGVAPQQMMPAGRGFFPPPHMHPGMPMMPPGFGRGFPPMVPPPGMPIGPLPSPPLPPPPMPPGMAMPFPPMAGLPPGMQPPPQPPAQ